MTRNRLCHPAGILNGKAIFLGQGTGHPQLDEEISSGCFVYRIAAAIQKANPVFDAATVFIRAPIEPQR